MIDDDELRQLFKAESTEHIRQIENGLLSLEQGRVAPDAVEAAFRAAHSLKGSARMLELSDIEMLMHTLEGMLREARKGGNGLTAARFEALYKGLDAVKELVADAVSGSGATVNLSEVMALLGRAENHAGARPAAAEGIEPVSEPPGAASPTVATSESADAASGQPASPEPAAAAEGPASTAVSGSASTGHTGPAHDPVNGGMPYRIETVRVPTERLDRLMKQTGELSVTRTRIDRRLQDVNDLREMLEQWAHGNFARRRLYATIEQAIDAPTRARLGRQHTDDEHLISQLTDRLDGLQAALYGDHERLDSVSTAIDEEVHTLRLLPLSNLFDLFPRMVRDLGQSQGKPVSLLVEGGDTYADKRIVESMKDPLMHLLRNAVDHGIEAPEERERTGKAREATIVLRAWQTGSDVMIRLTDDGRGLDEQAIAETARHNKLLSDAELAALGPEQLQALVFRSGFSTQPMVTDLSGRGIGLDVVRRNVEALKGDIALRSTPGQGCDVQLRLPVTLATTHVLLAEVAGRPVGVPVAYIESSVSVPVNRLFSVEGQTTITLDGEGLTVAPLVELLEQGSLSIRADSSAMICVVLRVGDARFGVLVDALLDEQQLVIKPHGAMLRRVRNVSGNAILGSGQICPILNPVDMLASLSRPGPRRNQLVTAVEPIQPKVILLAEDTLTTRTQEVRILRRAGYQVVVAVDGLDALYKLEDNTVDAVVSDVMMPNLDGIGLTERIRGDARWADLPVILVTTLATEEDRKRGLDAGANAYITKSAFDPSKLIDALDRLV